MRKVIILLVLFMIVWVNTFAQQLPNNYSEMFEKTVVNSGAKYVFDSVGRVAGPTLRRFVTLKNAQTPTKVLRVVSGKFIYTVCKNCKDVLLEKWDTIFVLEAHGASLLLDSVTVHGTFYSSALAYLDKVYFSPRSFELPKMVVTKPAKILLWPDQAMPIDAMTVATFIEPQACVCDLTDFKKVDEIYTFFYQGMFYTLSPVNGGYSLVATPQ